MKPRVLFILKEREVYGGCCYSYSHGISSGLFNSARLVNDMLVAAGIESKLVQVVDNNSIDKEVHSYRPTHVIIEALWVVPEKFDILRRLHPRVKWIVRIHSEIPFLAMEGIAIEWICRYLEYPNVYLSSNSMRGLREIRLIAREAHPYLTWQEIDNRVLYLPNYYPTHDRFAINKNPNHYFDVGCFGAIRPMKNQLNQAVAAVEVAAILNKTLRFHVNASRCEQGGETVLKNLTALMELTGNTLIGHTWMDHDQFLLTLNRMDIGLQVSFSETFNIVAADMVTSRIPVVLSPEMTWSSKFCQANPTDTKSIVDRMLGVLDWKTRELYKRLNLRGLRQFCEEAKEVWLDYLHV